MTRRSSPRRTGCRRAPRSSSSALEDINFASFELHNGLRVTKVTDEKGKPLTAERVTQDSAVRISFPTTMAKGSSSTLTFEYEGALANADDSPVEGLKLAYIGEDTTYLLYPARWFPLPITALTALPPPSTSPLRPVLTVVIGSGRHRPGQARAAPGKNRDFLYLAKTELSREPLSPAPFQESAFGSVKVYFRQREKAVCLHLCRYGQQAAGIFFHFVWPVTRGRNTEDCGTAG